jgi:hypothetical protein
MEPIKLPTVKIKDKDYVLVNERVKEFHRLYPEGSIETILVSEPTSNRIIMQTVAMPGNGRKFTGWAQEMIGDGFINKASALENCETSAVGRALGFLGIGIDTSIASVEEVQKAKDNSKAPELNKPTNEQRQAIATLLKELDITVTGDDQSEFTQICLDVIGVPLPLNRDQAEILQVYLQEQVLDREAERVMVKE